MEESIVRSFGANRQLKAPTEPLGHKFRVAIFRKELCCLSRDLERANKFRCL